jgi:hypothetical protein
MDNTAFPDFYADTINLAGGPFGLALTFMLSDPAMQGDPATARIVARIRLSPELARVLADALGQAGARAGATEATAAA